jgi:cytochrome P450
MSRMEQSARSSARETPMTGPTAKRARTLAEVPGPRGLPLLGNLLQVDTARFHQSLEAFWRAHGDLFSFRLGTKRCVGIADPTLVRTLLRERPHDFTRMSTMEGVARELGMHGLFSAEGEDWKRQRTLIMPAFRDSNLLQRFDTLRAITERLIDALEQQTAEPVTILDSFMRYAVDVMAQVSLGEDLNTLERGAAGLQQHLGTIFGMLLRRVLAPIPYWRYFKLPADRALDRALAAASQDIHAMIARAQRKLADDPARAAAPETLLEAMLIAANGDGQQLTAAEVLANVFTLLLGGEDTTANTLAWIVYYLALHPDVQAELRSEVDHVLGHSATLSDHTRIADMPLLTAVVHETLRLKGPAPFVALAATRDLKIADVDVPAGTPIFVLLRAVALRTPGTPNPESFDPRRWLDVSSAARTELARASMPFGAGPRICPGRQLALLECALAISALVKRYEVTLASQEPIRERFDFAMEPEDLRVHIRPR